MGFSNVADLPRVMYNKWLKTTKKFTKTSPVDNSSMTPDSGSKTLITPNEEYGEPRGT